MSVRNAVGILIGIALNSIDILTFLILPISDHGISSHLFVSLSFSAVLIPKIDVCLFSPGFLK